MTPYSPAQKSTGEAVDRDDARANAVLQTWRAGRSISSRIPDDLKANPNNPLYTEQALHLRHNDRLANNDQDKHYRFTSPVQTRAMERAQIADAVENSWQVLAEQRIIQNARNYVADLPTGSDGWTPSLPIGAHDMRPDPHGVRPDPTAHPTPPDPMPWPLRLAITLAFAVTALAYMLWIGG